MAGYAAMGATERDVRDVPGVYLDNLCGLRYGGASAGGSGIVTHPLCIPGDTYEEVFVSPLSGEFLSMVFIREPVSGTSAVLYVEVDGMLVGQLDLLMLEAETPTEIDFGGATVQGGETLITLRTECSEDVSPGAGLALTLGGVNDDMEMLLRLVLGGRKTGEPYNYDHAEPVP